MVLSKPELDGLAAINPEIKAIAESRKMQMPPIDYSDPVKAVMQFREVMNAIAKIPHNGDVTNWESSYPTRDDTANRMLIFRPSALPTEQKLPLIVIMHGGGGSIGSPEGTASFCQSIAQFQSAVVVSIAYRLAPEHKFPVGVQDCYDAVKHLGSAGAAKIGADPMLGFIIGGHSQGAVNSAVVALKLRDEGTSPPITGLYFGAGGFVAPQRVPKGYEDWYHSRNDERCLRSPILDEATKKMFDSVLGADYESPWYRACNYEGLRDYKDLPRAYFQICGLDILRDDSFIFEDILKQNGIQVKSDVYPGCPHVFWGIFGPGLTSQGTKWAKDTQAGFSWLLVQASSDSLAF